MITFTVFALWLHIAAIALWVGGLFAVSFVMVPVLKQGAGSPEKAAALFTRGLERFQRISRELLLVILLTGIFNLANAGMARGFSFGAQYLTMLGIKVGLFVTIAAIQLWQSLRLAPAIQAAASIPETSSGLYRRFLLTSLLNLGLGAAAVLLGLRLRYG